MIERLPASCFVHPVEQLDVTTGPMLLDRTIRDGGWESRPGIRIFPPRYFFPYDPSELGGAQRRSLARTRSITGDTAGRVSEGSSQRLRICFLVEVRQCCRRPAPSGVRPEVRSATTTRQRVASPAKRFLLRTARRLVPEPATLHGLPWGPGEVLVSTPFQDAPAMSNRRPLHRPELALTGTYDPSFVAFLEQRLAGRDDVRRRGSEHRLLHGPRRRLELGPGPRLRLRMQPRAHPVPPAQRRDELAGRPGPTHTEGRTSRRRGATAAGALTPERCLGSLTRFDNGENQVEDLHAFSVRCERLDVGLRDVTYVDLLKIDVEGGEAAVLDGASRLLDEGKIGVISMELRDDVLREDLREEMEKALTSLVQDRGATLHVPGDPPVPSRWTRC